MLSAFVAALAVAQETVPIQVDKVWPFLKKMGYAVSPAQPDNGYGILDLDGHDVAASVSISEDGTVRQFRLEFRYLPEHRVSPRYIQSWLHWRFELGGVPPLLRSELSGAVVMTAFLPWSGRDAKEVKQDFDRIDSDIESLQKELPAAQNPKPFPLDEDQTVDCLDPYDLGYVVDQWHWTDHHGGGSSGPTLPTWVEIDGVRFIAYQPFPGGPVRDHLALVGVGQVPVNQNESQVQDKVKPIEVVPNQNEEIAFRKEIDLSGGMKLSAIKAQFRDFALKIAPFVRRDRKQR